MLKRSTRHASEPDWETEEGDAKWPVELRQGSGVFGWVMLDEVPIWFEIWRQLNGFPPTIDEENSYGSGGKSMSSETGKAKK